MQAERIGIAPINWSNDDDPELGGDISYQQCIEEMAATGYRGCELGNKFPKSVDELTASLAPLGLEVSSAWFSSFLTEHGQFENTLAHFMQHLSLLKNLGASYVTVCECSQAIMQQSTPLLHHNAKLNDAQWQRLIQGLHIMGRLAHDYGIKLIYHFHLGTVVEKRKELDYLMQHTCPDLVGLLLDTGHAYVANMCPLQLIECYAERIDYVHLKDVREDVLTHVKKDKLNFMQAVRAGLFTVPGDGIIDYSQVFAKLKSIDYKGWLIVEAEQDPATANPKEYAIKARHTIKQLLGV